MGRNFSPLFPQWSRWGFFILWVLVGASQVSISSTLLFFCLHLFGFFFFGTMLASIYFPALLLILEPSFSFARAEIFSTRGLFSFVSVQYSSAYTLYDVYLFIIKKQCWLPAAHENGFVFCGCFIKLYFTELAQKCWDVKVRFYSGSLLLSCCCLMKRTVFSSVFGIRVHEKEKNLLNVVLDQEISMY